MTALACGWRGALPGVGQVRLSSLRLALVVVVAIRTTSSAGPQSLDSRPRGTSGGQQLDRESDPAGCR